MSTAFLNADFCNGEEMAMAVARHEDRKTIVIPVVLRPCMWRLNKLLSRIRALPQGDLPVTKWIDRDDALTNVAEGIYEVAQKLIQKRR